MSEPAASNPVEQQLLDDYVIYDQHVDVISAMEWLFTDPAVQALPATVAHFERYPRISVDGRRDPLTPDFTVLFHDGSAIVGEIARISLHENSVDKLCRQIGNYAALTQVPGGDGRLVDVHRVDVMQLVEATIGLSAVRRIIKDRYLDPESAYKPPRAPCIVQFGRNDVVYWFQRIPDPDNGAFYGGVRTPHIGDRLDADLRIKASHFVRTKARRVFINDPITPLYLATHLWTRAWPSEHGSERGDITVDAQRTAATLRRQYGTGSVAAVRQALDLLQRAGLATSQGRDAWVIERRLLGRSGDRDVHKIIARRAGGRSIASVARRAVPPPSLRGMDPLF